MLADPDFIPFEPPVGSNLKALKRNTVETIPLALYQRPCMVRYKRLLSDSILLTDPDRIHELLVEKAEHFERDTFARRLLAPLIGERALLMAEGAEWRWQRRAAAPAFRHDSLLQLVPLMTASARRQIEAWRKLPTGQPIDASWDMTRVTFEIITETLFGRTNALDFDAYGDTLYEYSRSLPARTLLYFTRLPAWTPFPGRRRSMRGRDRMLELIRDPVKNRAGLDEKAPSGLFDLLHGAEDPETGRRMTDEEFVKNIATFLAAGHETTAVALTWTLWLLAKDPETQERVAEEVQRVLGDDPVEARHVDKLGFTRQVVQEAMRLYPPVPAMGRQPTRELEFGGLKIGPRSVVSVAIYALHRNRGLWEQPDAFDPGRFAPDKVKARHRYAYLPFGGGPRVCIGQVFSLIEATTILAEAVRAFRFAPQPGYRPQILGHVTMRPHEGMPLYLTPRAPGRRRAPRASFETAAGAASSG
jgi:cytochrome P450